MTSPCLRRILPTLLSALSLAAASLPAAPPSASSGLAIEPGRRLVFVAYGDTRPNLYPFGKQRKHRALTQAIRQYDAARQGEVDAVLVSGDLIFADVPWTDRDWAPAYEAMAVLRERPHPLLLYPALGNHELLTLSDQADDDKVREMVGALWRWGGSEAQLEATLPLRPVVLAQMTHLAELAPAGQASAGQGPAGQASAELASAGQATAGQASLLARQLPAGFQANDFRVLWNQMSSEVVDRLPEGARESLARAARNARVAVRLAALRGRSPASLAAELAGREPDMALERVHSVVNMTRETGLDPAVARLAAEALGLLADPSSPAGRLLHASLGTVFEHLAALRALATQAGGEHERLWLGEVAADSRAAFGKSWTVMKEHYAGRLPESLLRASSLAALPHDRPGFVGPSWYYTDRAMPGVEGRAVRFVTLNSNLATVASGPGTEPLLDQEAFLADAIRSATGPVVLLAHHAPVSIGPHGGAFDPAGDLISALREMVYRRVFPRLSAEEQRRVWTLICGHDHDLQRLVDVDRGTAILVSGGGGVPLKDQRVPPAETPAYLARCGQLMGTTLGPEPRLAKAYSFLACDVTPGRMEFRVFGVVEPAGGTMDDSELERALPGAVAGQLADDGKLLEHFVIRERPDGSRVIEDL